MNYSILLTAFLLFWTEQLNTKITCIEFTTDQNRTRKWGKYIPNSTSYLKNAFGGNCKTGFGVSPKSIKSSLLCEKFMDNGQNNVFKKCN